MVVAEVTTTVRLLNKVKLTCILYILLLLSVTTQASRKGDRSQVDSVMRHVVANAALYEQAVASYEAEVYVKGLTTVQKKNLLLYFANLVFPVESNQKETAFEMVSDFRYEAPGNYHHDIRAINSNRPFRARKQKEVLSFINLNVYSPTIYDKGIIMPIARGAFRYYNFYLEGTEDIAGIRIYHIRFSPKQWSQKLLDGELYIIDKSWTIDRIVINGLSTLSEFTLQMRFSRDRRYFLLPEEADLKAHFHALGNKLTNSYHVAFRYRAVTWTEEDNEPPQPKPLDRTRYFSLSSDTIPIVRDTAYWLSKRDAAPTPEELNVYRLLPGQSSATTDSNSFTPYLKMTGRLTYTMNLDYKTTRVKYSGLLNPFQLGYSGSNGFTYHQRIRISKTFARDRQLRFRPELGYVFKRRQLFFKLAADWEYLPSRMGVLSLIAANDNPSYPAGVMAKIGQQLQDSVFQLADERHNKFHHYYVDLRNSIELANGLRLEAGLSLHRRVPTTGGGTFHDFTPSVGLTYTPRQYYWMDGYRKEYLYSHFPTFSIEVVQAIPGVGQRAGNYGRVETDMHQSIRIGLSQRLNYHLSGGFYFNRRSLYFSDFRYFARRYFPESWDDRFGGVFNQLKGEWYNVSDSYVQGHLMFESPLLLLQLFKTRHARYVVSERLYLGQLWTPSLPCYTELGYGVGSDLFNVGVFAGFEQGRYRSVGVKLTFELFQ